MCINDSIGSYSYIPAAYIYTHIHTSKYPHQVPQGLPFRLSSLSIPLSTNYHPQNSNRSEKSLFYLACPPSYLSSPRRSSTTTLPRSFRLFPRLLPILLPSRPRRRRLRLRLRSSSSRSRSSRPHHPRPAPIPSSKRNRTQENIPSQRQHGRMSPQRHRNLLGPKPFLHSLVSFHASHDQRGFEHHPLDFVARGAVLGDFGRDCGQ